MRNKKISFNALGWFSFKNGDKEPVFLSYGSIESVCIKTQNYITVKTASGSYYSFTGKDAKRFLERFCE